MFLLAAGNGIVGGLYSKSDGCVDPTGLTNSLAKGAKMAGATVMEDCPVERVVVGAESGIVEGVQTREGLLRAGKVILCAGSWSRGAIQCTLKHHESCLCQKVTRVYT